LQENPPYWLVVPEVLKQKAPEGMPNPLEKEQASRLAGLVVTPIFKIYYPMQACCAFFVLLLINGKVFVKDFRKVGKSSTILFFVAAIMILVNWILLGPTEKARLKRANSTDEYVLASAENKPKLETILADRKEFAKIHGISLIINLVSGLALLGGVVSFSFRESGKAIPDF